MALAVVTSGTTMTSDQFLESVCLTTNSVIQSSLKLPFVVVSELQLVEGVQPASGWARQDLFQRLNSIIDFMEKERSVLLADFEGEMPGFGGELVTAAFMPTAALDCSTLKARPAAATRAGLLLDMRCPNGAALVRRLMESASITKVIWGADGDLTSLRHQVHPHPLGFACRAVLDAQLAFSTPQARLGMARILERVPPDFMAELPKKECIDFNMPHSLNKRALSWPLREVEARYAVDDLHRLDMILRTQVPLCGGGYLAALAMSTEIMGVIDSDPDGLAWLQRELSFFERKRPGVQRRAQAVQLARHIKTLRAQGVLSRLFIGSTPQEEAAFEFIAAIEPQLDTELLADGIVIPSDVAFAS